MNRDSSRDAIQRNPLTSMRRNRRRLAAEAGYVQRTVAKLGRKSHVILKRPLFTPATRAKRLKRCQRLVDDLMFPPVGRVIISSDEKSWTVDPVGNRRKERQLSHGHEEGRAHTICQKRNIQHLSCRSVL